MDVYVILCHYEGCGDCGPGTHIVGVYRDNTEAKNRAKEHQTDKNNHFHHFYVDVERWEVR